MAVTGKELTQLRSGRVSLWPVVLPLPIHESYPQGSVRGTGGESLEPGLSDQLIANHLTEFEIDICDV